MTGTHGPGLNSFLLVLAVNGFRHREATQVPVSSPTPGPSEVSKLLLIKGELVFYQYAH